ncbi:hypothetical protein CYY_008102 [Polysphondylium violaceum]|uniref:FNIP repeat-containing protein n=1 Tax=Polysphondylium violaceum TaxID=133409 RepID=A0A8J4PNT5_9MYCE|nr:hypothetical protein CYY_008102 [Polysphondylium violaceum]
MMDNTNDDDLLKNYIHNLLINTDVATYTNKRQSLYTFTQLINDLELERFIKDNYLENIQDHNDVALIKINWSMNVEFNNSVHQVCTVVIKDTLATDVAMLVEYYIKANKERYDRYSAHDPDGIFKNINLVLAVNATRNDNPFIKPMVSILNAIPEIRSIVIRKYKFKDEIYNDGDGKKSKSTRFKKLFKKIKQLELRRILVQDMVSCKSEHTIAEKEYQDDFDEYSWSYKDAKEIPSSVTHLLWNHLQYPMPGEIPSSIQKLTFDSVYSSWREMKGGIPASVKYIKFSFICGIPLSYLDLPPALKYLSLNYYDYFIFTRDLPETLSHLEIHLKDENYAYHWLTFKGTLGRNISHLKIHQATLGYKLSSPFLIPTTVQYLCFNQENRESYLMVAADDYHRVPVTQDNVDWVSSIKSVKVLSRDSIISSLYFYSQHLQSMEINAYSNDINANQLPTSLTSLTCESLSCVPDHARLNYLAYRFQIYKLIFKSNDRAITKQGLPRSFNEHTALFTPHPMLPIEEFHINSSYYNINRIEMPPNVVIKTINTEFPITLPDSVQIYESNQLPPNYPPSLTTIILKKEFNNQLSCLPSTIKHLYIELDNQNKSILLKPIILKDKYILSNNIKGISKCSKDSFLQIFRNQFLRIKIYELNLVKLVKMKKTRNIDDIEVYSFSGGSDHYSHSDQSFKLCTNDIAIVPNGVRYYSIANRIKLDKQYLLRELPPSVVKLKVICDGLKTEMIAPTVKHLVIMQLNGRINIPSSIETLEIKSQCWGFDSFRKDIATQRPSNLKRLIIAPNCLQEYLTASEINTVFKTRDLFRSQQIYQFYEFYSFSPIKPSTTVLVWSVNLAIPVGHIPNTIKTIIFSSEFNQTILAGALPTSVTEISFGKSFNQCLSQVSLPTSLLYLSLVNYRHPILPNSLPPNLISLHIKSCPKKEYQYPTSLIHLPKSIRFIKVDKLKLKQDFSTGSRGESSNSVIQFTSVYSDCSLDQQRAIATINQSIDELDSTATALSTTTTTNLSTVDVHLTIVDDIPILPGSLDHLNVKSIKFDLKFNQPLPLGSLPNTLTRLEFIRGCSFSQEVLYVPQSIQYLNLGSLYNDLKSLKFPPSLVELYLPQSFNSTLEVGTLSPGLKVLSFGQSYEKPIGQGVIPNTVSTLHLYQKQCFQLFPNVVPVSVTELYINHQTYSLDTHLSLNLLPKSIVKLYLGTHVKTGNMDDLPSNIKFLQITSATRFTGRIPSFVEYVEIKDFKKPLFTLKDQ